MIGGEPMKVNIIYIVAHLKIDRASIQSGRKRPARRGAKRHRPPNKEAGGQERRADARSMAAS
jgi:hypothetical protein